MAELIPWWADMIRRAWMWVSLPVRRHPRISLAIAIALFTTLGLMAWFVPLPKDLFSPVAATVTILDIRGRVVAQVASADARASHPIPLAAMGPYLPKVTVALEDHRFYEHDGVDYTSLGGTILRNLRHIRIVNGASTITQQTVKLASRRHGKNPFSKIYEIFAAMRVERIWTKDQILEDYLNRSHYSNRRVGPVAAAAAYFGKTPAALTMSEAIFLAGLPQAPTRHNPWLHLDKAMARYQRSLDRLQELGTITPEEAKAFAANPPVIRREIPPHNAPHFVEAMLADDPDTEGTVHSTLDLDLQIAAEALVRGHINSIRGQGVTTAAMVILDNETGGIRAMVGSADYAAAGGQINGARTFRSCGSTLKPFVYLDAIERKLLTAATLMPDTPGAIREHYIDYDPQNYDENFYGPVRVREALGNSLNVPAVVTLSKVGARHAYSELEQWGVHFPRQLTDYGAGLILGNAEVTLVDLAGAYSGLARGGWAMPPKYRTTQSFASKRMASPEAVSIITDIMADNDARKRSFGLSSPLYIEGKYVPVKTGTSSGFRDGWTVGFTKQHTLAVWAGNIDGSPMHAGGAVRSAGPLWRAAMLLLLKDDETISPPTAEALPTHVADATPALPQPAAPAATGRGAAAGSRPTLVRASLTSPPSDAATKATPPPLFSVEVCTLTGLLPCAESPGRVREYFLPGTVPDLSASKYLTLLPNGSVQVRLPAEYAAWCQSKHNYLGAEALVEGPPHILTPAPGAVYQMEPLLPIKQQMLELTTNQGPRVEVAWRVNGVPVQPQQGKFLWPLTPGEHKVEVNSPSGTAEASFRVEK